ncbi:hypothetical protein [Vibrio furnissii]|uniref:hypothetical protein n=1 Tax=Vibrio furnissii TaxID=29494 RepID=UPI001EEA3C5C|nr:hypothetical protein [Vibrio furnissii]MCG6268314.1 hypothetical protein [Vibrio furnissii]
MDVLERYCRDVELFSNYPSYSNESPNLHVEVVEIPSHRFELNYQSVRLVDEDHRLFWTAVESMRAGRAFTWSPKKLTTIKGAGGNAAADSTPAGSETLSVYNVTAPAGVVWLKAGDLITVANQTKVYMVMLDATPDNAGRVTLSLNCPIKTAVPAGTVVNGSGAAFTLIRKPGAKPQSFKLSGQTAGKAEYSELEFVELL